jgi:hypothetical protein
MNSKIELRIVPEIPFANIGTVQRLVQSFAGGGGILELTHGEGAAVLRWKRQETDLRPVRVAMPLRWLTDPEQVERLETSVCNFMTEIRLSSHSN